MRWAGFLPQMLIRRYKHSVTTKLHSEHETPPIANVLLCPVLTSYLSSLLNTMSSIKTGLEPSAGIKDMVDIATL